MSARYIQIPVIETDGQEWLLLKHLDSKVVFRAFNIEKPRAVHEANQHQAFETVAEGGVKCRPKRWRIIG